MIPAAGEPDPRLAGFLAARGSSPALCQRDHRSFVVGPVMQGRGVEVGAIRPDERVGFTIDLDRVEELDVLQRGIELAFEDRPEVDRPDQAVRELDPQPVRPTISNPFTLWTGCPTRAPSYRSGSILPGRRLLRSLFHAASSSGESRSTSRRAGVAAVAAHHR